MLTAPSIFGQRDDAVAELRDAEGTEFAPDGDARRGRFAWDPVDKYHPVQPLTL
jgi:hypothetical protein